MLSDNILPITGIPDKLKMTVGQQSGSRQWHKVVFCFGRTAQWHFRNSKYPCFRMGFKSVIDSQARNTCPV